MNRDQKINALLAQGDDDVRRLALDEIDEGARRENTFGSKEHRAARDRVEERHNDARRGFEALSEGQMDAAIAKD